MNMLTQRVSVFVRFFFRLGYCKATLLIIHGFVAMVAVVNNLPRHDFQLQHIILYYERRDGVL